MRWKSVCRWDPKARVYRIGRLLWKYGHVGDGQGYSAKFSISLTPLLFHWLKEYHHNYYLIIFGIRLHYMRSYGGHIV